MLRSSVFTEESPSLEYSVALRVVAGKRLFCDAPSSAWESSDWDSADWGESSAWKSPLPEPARGSGVAVSGHTPYRNPCRSVCLQRVRDLI